ncbi:electron transport complex subunit RsxC, partial [Salmonella enterica subsp. enterica serovar Enteritidis]
EETPVDAPAEPVDPRKAAVEAAIARAKARKAQAEEIPVDAPAEPADPRKAAVEAAIARAKARKEAQQEEQAANDDPRKAAISA